jgi:hypothetical protein
LLNVIIRMGCKVTKFFAFCQIIRDYFVKSSWQTDRRGIARMRNMSKKVRNCIPIPHFYSI